MRATTRTILAGLATLCAAAPAFAADKVVVALSQRGTWDPTITILAEKHGQLLPAGRIALWLVVAVALISGVEYFLRFFRQIVLEGPPPSPEP